MVIYSLFAKAIYRMSCAYLDSVIFRMNQVFLW